jgi:hypothetical protein
MKAGITLFTLLLLASCGKDNSSGKNNGISTMDAYHQRPLEVTQTEEVTFTRIKKMRFEYDCDRHVIKSGMATTNALSKTVAIKGVNRNQVWRYQIHNRTNNASGGTKILAKGRFTIDHSPTLFHMKVETGPNLIEYVAYQCAVIVKDEAGVKNCASGEEVLKEGLIQINVNYGVEIAAGEDHVNPAAETCRSQR